MYQLFQFHLCFCVVQAWGIIGASTSNYVTEKHKFGLPTNPVRPRSWYHPLTDLITLSRCLMLIIFPAHCNSKDSMGRADNREHNLLTNWTLFESKKVHVYHGDHGMHLPGTWMVACWRPHKPAHGSLGSAPPETKKKKNPKLCTH